MSSRFKFFDEENTKDSVQSSKFILTYPLGKLRYNILVSQNLNVNGRNFVNSRTHIIWSLIVEDVTSENIIVAIKTEQNKVLNTTPDSTDLLNFSLIFNIPLEYIRLKLNKYGGIEDIMNQNEIFDKWGQLKKNELLKYRDDMSMKGIFTAGDLEFSSSLKVLQQNILYTLFFNDVYNKEIENNISNKHTFKTNSKLFQGNFIDFNHSQSINKNHDKINVNDSFLQKMTDFSNLKKLYEKDYKVITGDNFSYSYGCNATSIYEAKEGYLEKTTARMEEKANNALFHILQYQIELIK